MVVKTRDDQSEDSFFCISRSKVFDELDYLDDHYADTAQNIED